MIMCAHNQTNRLMYIARSAMCAIEIIKRMWEGGWLFRLFHKQVKYDDSLKGICEDLLMKIYTISLFKDGVGIS